MISLHDQVRSALAPIAADPLTVAPAASVSPDLRYLSILNNGRIRWLVPQSAALGLPVLQNWFPHSRASRLKWRALLTAYRFSQLARIPGIETLGVDATFLSPDGRPCAPVVYFGTPTPMRKAITSLVSRDTRQVLAVVKSPLAPDAPQAIAREADALRQLSTAKPGMAPRLLSYTAESNVSVQQFILGRSAPLRFQPSYLDWLLRLALPGQTVSLDAHLHAAQARLARLNGHAARHAPAVASALARLPRNLDYPAFIIHGDFAPWNLRIDARGSMLAAVDWEEFSSSGLPLFDYFHYHYMQAYLFQTPIALGQLSRESAEYCTRVGLSQADVTALAAAYLVDSLAHFGEQRDLAHCDWIASQLAAAKEV